MQSMERMKAVREKRSGISAEGRMIKQTLPGRDDDNEVDGSVVG